MTVKELKEKLSQYSDGTEVRFSCDEGYALTCTEMDEQDPNDTIWNWENDCKIDIDFCRLYD
jgi:hypothetical protein